MGFIFVSFFFFLPCGIDERGEKELKGAFMLTYRNFKWNWFTSLSIYGNFFIERLFVKF